MKKIIRNSKFKIVLSFILGGIIFGSIGVVATNYLLKAEDVEYRDNKNLQDAIDELYGMASNQSGNNLYKVQVNETPTSTAHSIAINFTKVEPTLTCRAKDASGNIVGTGIVTDNTCNITGLQPETPYTYEIIGTQASNTGVLATGTKATTQIGPTMQTTNLVSTTGTTYQGLLGIVYLDPTNLNTSCNASNYTSSNSATGTKTGCLKWYVYGTVTEDGVEKYKMILDHNTTAKIAYNKTNKNQNYGTTYGEVGYDLALLTTSTSSGGSGWNSSLNPRLITADEIAGIVGLTNWTSATNTDGFSFDSETRLPTETHQGESAYAWLFDYTDECTLYGCNVEGVPNGYWTSSKKYGNSSFVWHVHLSGSLSANSAYSTYGSNQGLRPVITVSASILTQL